MDLTALNETNTIVEKNAGGMLRICVDGNWYEPVKLVRTFPYMAENEYISVRCTDVEETEVGIIVNLEQDFSGRMLDVLRDELSTAYFTPLITKIYSIKEQQGCSYFDVETSAGRRNFAIRSNENAVRKLTQTRILIRDLEGARYEIRDLHALSQREQKKMDIFL